jgi:hypothetical protein
MPADLPSTPRFSRALEAQLREQAAAPRRRRRLTAGALAVALAAAVALAFIVLPAPDERGEQASPPPGRLVISSRDMFEADRAGLQRLQAELAARGKKLVIHERPVSPDSQYVGHVIRYGVKQAGVLDPIVVDRLRVPVVVTVGVAARSGRQTKVPYVCRTLPQLMGVVDGHDATGSIRRLRQMGFDIKVKRLPWARPGEPHNTVMGIFGPDGKAGSITPRTRKLTIVVGSAGRFNTGSAGC